MWSEIDALRGSNEIASCLYTHILEQLSDCVEKVTIFSRSRGLDRNNTLAAMFLTLVQRHPCVKVIEHVFVETGLTPPECDTWYSVVEGMKSDLNVNVSSDWYDLIREIRIPSTTLQVVEMKGKFLDFKSLLKPGGPLVRRMITAEQSKFYWMSTPALVRYEAEHPGKIFFRKTLKDIGYGCLSFVRNSERGKLAAVNLPQYVSLC